MKLKITKEIAKAAVYGGQFLGGGGGGGPERGLKTAEVALSAGELYLYTDQILSEEDLVITASAVGSPASTNGYITAEDCINAFNMLKTTADLDIKAIITNENGGHSTTNGWVLAASTGLPLIDAPCNGRAHPTGPMGSMGLSELENYETVQVAIGGKKENEKHVELFAKGSLGATSALVRLAAVEADGLVTVLRNPVTASYVRKNAALGGLKQAIAIGEVLLNEHESIEKLAESLSGIFPTEVVAMGTVSKYDLQISGGFDVGFVTLQEENGDSEFTFWNEYMTLERNGERIATFPDLLVTVDLDTLKVVNSPEFGVGDNIALLRVNKEDLKLGAGMFDKNLFVPAEDVLGKELIKYSFK